MDPIFYYLIGGALIVFIPLGFYLKRINKKAVIQEQQLQQQQEVIQRQQVKQSSPVNQELIRLQLQAYERMAILCERIGLINLLGRSNVNELTAQQLQLSMIQNIRTEFEYNVSQQLYVSAAAWDAVKNLKEQNIFIINQIASMLPANAGGADLSAKIIELLSQEENASLQNIVATLINKEAKQLMG
ncbi:MAG: hypothetical protein QM725_03685 [Lacibacter sp.]